eukprot:m.9682 g.9682  ORF g.9682 m.9682 type:complete len:489 (+) comp4113_c0_seq1:109-1575(+)
MHRQGFPHRHGGSRVEYSYQNPCCNALGGFCFGMFLLFLSIVGLWYNEGVAVQTAQSLDEGLQLVAHVDSETLDPANHGKLVHVSGKLEGLPVLEDQELGLSASASSFERIVEMYQWREQKHTRNDKMPDGSTRTETWYTYSQEWSSSQVNSNHFHDAEPYMTNPHAWPLRSSSQHAHSANIGAHKVSSSQLSRIGTARSVGVQALLEGTGKAPIGIESSKKKKDDMSRTKRRGADKSVDNTAARNKAMASFNSYNLQIRGGSLQSGNPGHPQVGDIRVSYRVKNPQQASIVALQTPHGFEEFEAPSGDVFDLVEEGIHGPRHMFAKAQTELQIRTWAFRMFGWLAMFFGLYMLTSAPLAFVEAIPLLGGFTAGVLGSITCLASLLISLGLSLVIIAAGWLWYRPLITLAIMLAAMIPSFLGYRNVLSCRAQQHPQPPQQQSSNYSNPPPRQPTTPTASAPKPRKKRLPEPSAPDEPPPYSYGNVKHD